MGLLVSEHFGDQRGLHSFPTRRSSDLDGADQREGLIRLAKAHAVAEQAAEPVLLEQPEPVIAGVLIRSEEHTSELQSQSNIVCRLLLVKQKYLHLLVPSYFAETLGVRV